MMWSRGLSEQSETMPFDLAQMFRGDSNRRTDRRQLLIPCLSEVSSKYCEELVNNQLTECARVIKAKGGIYRWRKYDAPAVLVIWDKDTKVFINFDNAGFCEWLGTNFDLSDRMGVHFGLPHAAVAAKIWEELVKDSTGLQSVGWQTVSDWRRQG
jgi:hypothetical protein